MTATFQQPNYATDNGAAYPANIDAALQVMAGVAGDLACHAVPPACPAPVLSQVAGGAIGATTYFVKLVLVTTGGFECIPSSESSFSVSANNLLVVAPPGNTSGTGTVAGVQGYNVYVSTSAGTETRQNGSTPIALGTSWTLPTSGLVGGAALPAGMSLLSVLVDPGSMLYQGGIVAQAQQHSANITAPAVNPRIDRVVADMATLAISLITGAEAASPVPPAITAGKIPIAQIALIVGQTAIGNANITDERTAMAAPYGQRTIWVPAGAIIPRVTNGPTGPTTTEMATNKNVYRSLTFATAVVRTAEFDIKMPPSWDLGQITACFHWADFAAGSGNVVWSLQGNAIRDNSTLDFALGTYTNVTDTNNGQNKLNISPDTAAITIGGSPVSRDHVRFTMRRQGTSGSDTLGDSADLLGIEIRYNTNKPDDS